ncbi:nucleolar and coiled-body phosphoprotein 1-like [Passer domesticus]|uniref:nucleolar and coiled-body phosphoprotein 1-like n=1 Tax=Passer domesticus TaxID=48849 RepID=UPI0030FE0823
MKKVRDKEGEADAPGRHFRLPPFQDDRRLDKTKKMQIKTQKKTKKTKTTWQMKKTKTLKTKIKEAKKTKMKTTKRKKTKMKTMKTRSSSLALSALDANSDRGRQRQTRRVTSTKATPTPSPQPLAQLARVPQRAVVRGSVRSVLPLSKTEEEERPFIKMDCELSQWEDVQERQQKEMPRVQETSQQTARSSQELSQHQSPPQAQPAAAPPAGAAEEEESPEPLAPGAEEAAEPPAPREELPAAGTQSPVPAPLSPPGCSQALLDLVWIISYVILSRALLDIQGSGQQPQEQRQQGESQDPAVAGKATEEREESPVPAPQSTPRSGSALLGIPAPREQPGWAVPESELAQEGRQESSAWDSGWDAYSVEEDEVESDLSQWGDSSLEEVSQLGDDVSLTSWEKVVGPVKEEEESQPCPPEGPSSASPMGAEVAAEEVPALPSTSPAPGRATMAELAAAEEEESSELALSPLSQDGSFETSVWDSDSEDYCQVEEPDYEVQSLLSQWADASLEDVSHLEDSRSFSCCQKREGPVKGEDSQPCPPEGPSSASPVGTELAAEALPALPSTSPALGRATMAELQAEARSGAGGRVVTWLELPRKRPSRFRRALRALRGLFCYDDRVDKEDEEKDTEENKEDKDDLADEETKRVKIKTKEAKKMKKDKGDEKEEEDKDEN